MQKATLLLTLALGVGTLCASAQTYSADKVYTFKNKGNSNYASAMPSTDLMAAKKTIDLSCLFKITPVSGETDKYTIQPYADNARYVYYLNTNDANGNIGLTSNVDEGKTESASAKTQWIITTSSNDGFMLVKPGNGEGSSWNKRGTNSDWGLDGLGQWIWSNTAQTASADLKDDNQWAISEVSDDDITSAITAYKTTYITPYATLTTDKQGLVGYPANIKEITDKIKDAVSSTDAATLYPAAIKPNCVVLPTDGKAYKFYSLFKNGEKAYAKHSNNQVYIAQKKSNGKYSFVSVVGDESAMKYNNSVTEFTVATTYRFTVGALNLLNGDQCIGIRKDAGAMGHFTGKGYQEQGTATTQWSTEIYFEEVPTSDFAGQTVTFTASNDGKNYATLNLPYATTLPTGVTAYKKGDVTDTDVNLVEYKTAGNVLPANTPVLLTATEAGEKTFAPAAYAASEDTGFKGTLGATAVTDDNAYILAKKNEEVKFYALNSESNTVNANKAYLVIAASAGAQALNFNFGEVTGINQAINGAQRVNAPIYDLSGRRVMKAVKGGIYIQNGKKFVK